ncbi:MAG: right-handed parallel beta-helix repeat-containing protein [Planctomycetota bacterium]
MEVSLRRAKTRTGRPRWAYSAAALPAMRRIALAFLLSTTLPSQRLYVDAAAPPGGDGTTWARAYRDLGVALQQANAGTELWVARGTHAGGFAVPAGVLLLGGFAPGDQRPTQRRPRSTVLDGQDSQRVVSLGADAVLDGFHVVGGRADGLGGGAILIQAGAPVVRNCSFTANRNVQGRGAVILVTGGADPRIEYNLIYGNLGFGHNIDVDGAGGVYEHNVIWDNVENGIHLMDSTASIASNIIGANTGRGICDVGQLNAPSVENNLLFANQRAVFHYRGTDFQTIDRLNALPYARANLAGDPLFAGAANADFRLTAASPALERGLLTRSTDPDAGGASRTADGDLDGSARPDIGAFEFHHANLTVHGAPTPGTTIQLQLDGASGLPAAVVLATRPAAAILPRYGTVFVDLLGPLVALPFGNLPSTRPLTIPGTVRANTSFVLQGFAASGAAGTLGNLIDVRVR